MIACGVCDYPVEVHPDPTFFTRNPWANRKSWMPTVILLSPEAHEHGTVLVGPNGLEFPTDPARLRDEGVPLRRDHSLCRLPKSFTARKRVWTKAGWRMR